MALKRWSIASFAAPETKTLLTAAASVETILLSLFISNYSGSVDALIVIKHTDGTNTLFEFPLTITKDNSPFALDSLWVLYPGDEITVTSNVNNVSVLASGDES